MHVWIKYFGFRKFSFLYNLCEIKNNDVAKNEKDKNFMKNLFNDSRKVCFREKSKKKNLSCTGTVYSHLVQNKQNPVYHTKIKHLWLKKKHTNKVP